jgi:hypothetical protein
MSEAKHTPGPWRIDPDATFIGDHYVGTDAADIALMASWSLELEPEQWANARLIAAAPELVEVAPDAADLLEQYADFIRTVPADELERHPYLPSIEDAARGLRAAIAKATGAA